MLANAQPPGYEVQAAPLEWNFHATVVLNPTPEWLVEKVLVPGFQDMSFDDPLSAGSWSSRPKITQEGSIQQAVTYGISRTSVFPAGVLSQIDHAVVVRLCPEPCLESETRAARDSDPDAMDIDSPFFSRNAYEPTMERPGWWDDPEPMDLDDVDVQMTGM